jgi:UDP-N-acetylmuramyl tripeptide synthase
MGRIAGELADVAVVTSDNPRTEDPKKIVEEIEAGLRADKVAQLETKALATSSRGYCVIEDRRSAIQRALRAAAPGDVVLIAGKGHEKYQVIGERKEPFDDCVEAQRALASREGRA